MNTEPTLQQPAGHRRHRHRHRLPRCARRLNSTNAGAARCISIPRLRRRPGRQSSQGAYGSAQSAT